MSAATRRAVLLVWFDVSREDPLLSLLSLDLIRSQRAQLLIISLNHRLIKLLLACKELLLDFPMLLVLRTHIVCRICLREILAAGAHLVILQRSQHAFLELHTRSYLGCPRQVSIKIYRRLIIYGV